MIVLYKQTFWACIPAIRKYFMNENKLQLTIYYCQSPHFWCFLVQNTIPKCRNDFGWLLATITRSYRVYLITQNIWKGATNSPRPPKKQNRVHIARYAGAGTPFTGEVHLNFLHIWVSQSLVRAIEILYTKFEVKRSRFWPCRRGFTKKKVNRP